MPSWAAWKILDSRKWICCWWVISQLRPPNQPQPLVHIKYTELGLIIARHLYQQLCLWRPNWIGQSHHPIFDMSRISLVWLNLSLLFITEMCIGAVLRVKALHIPYWQCLLYNPWWSHVTADPVLIIIGHKSLDSDPPYLADDFLKINGCSDYLVVHHLSQKLWLPSNILLNNGRLYI